MRRTWRRTSAVSATARVTLARARNERIANPRAEIEDAFHVAQEIGDRRGAAVSAATSALVALDDGDAPAYAAQWFLTCLEHGVTVEYWRAGAWSMVGSMHVVAEHGHWAEPAWRECCASTSPSSAATSRPPSSRAPPRPGGDLRAGARARNSPGVPAR